MTRDPDRAPLGDPLLHARLTTDGAGPSTRVASPFGPPQTPRVEAPPPGGQATSRPRPLPRSTAPRRPRRRHPAKHARLGALVVSCAATGGLTLWFSNLDGANGASQAITDLPAALPVTPTTAATNVPTSPASTTPTSTPASTSPAATTPAPTPAATTPASTSGSTQVAVFNGTAVDTRYGPIQVQVQVTGGKVSDVAVVEYPDSDRKSVRINADALPTLRSEVISAQSAHVDSVSGATYTSRGYITSLQSAIDQARAAGATTIV